MEFWLYVYVAIAIIFIFAVIWVYTRLCEWWSENVVSDEKDYLREIFIYENNQYHLLRSYILETHMSLECNGETLELYTENCQSLLEVWSKILNKEHFLKFSDLQRKRWNLYLSLLEGASETKTNKELRSVNRRLSQLHEDWWGLRFDASGYMRELNEIDADVIELNSCLTGGKSSNSTFHSILFHQEAIEKKILKVLG